MSGPYPRSECKVRVRGKGMRMGSGRVWRRISVKGQKSKVRVQKVRFGVGVRVGYGVR